MVVSNYKTWSIVYDCTLQNIDKSCQLGGLVVLRSVFVNLYLIEIRKFYVLYGLKCILSFLYKVKKSKGMFWSHPKLSFEFGRYSIALKFGLKHSFIKLVPNMVSKTMSWKSKHPLIINLLSLMCKLIRKGMKP